MNRLLAPLLLSLFAASANGALINRGGGLIYDSDLNITWLLDANLAATNTFGLPLGVDLGMHPSDSVGGVSLINAVADGTMTWSASLFWIDAMNTDSYLGFSNWRLPTTPQPDTTCSDSNQGTGSGCINSEMGHLFNVDGISSTTQGPFINVNAGDYWFGVENVSDTDSAWEFRFDNGSQSHGLKGHLDNAWAVHDGDIGAIPIPTTAWLFASALALLGWMRRTAD